MSLKHNKFQITSITCGIVKKANLTSKALSVTCLKLKEVQFKLKTLREKFKYSFCMCVCVYITTTWKEWGGVFFRNWNCLMVANNKKYRPSMYNR